MKKSFATVLLSFKKQEFLANDVLL